MNLKHNMGHIKVFIISWSGWHDNAVKIAKEISKYCNQITVIYSDNNSATTLSGISFKSIQRPDYLYFSDKFSTCINNCSDTSALFIHADCECNDWSFLFNKYCNALTNVPKMGVWTPQIIGTPYNLSVSGIAKVNNSMLHIGTLIDGIVFGLSPSIIERMRRVDYSENKFGWGISALICAHAYTTNQLVIIDESVIVKHHLGTGYDRLIANQERRKFITQFSNDERIMTELIYAWIKLKSL